MQQFRTGSGFDVHTLVENRELVLGGITIPFHKGLLGHSDADVLVHAIIDALLGAAALGDIGTHFPDTDARYKDISSLILLDKTAKLIGQSGYKIGNIDTIIVLEKPKLKSFIPQIIANLSTVLKIEKSAVSVKATSTEGLGFTGRGEGAAAYASVLIYKGESRK